MAYLLDTHTIIWMVEGDSRLSGKVSSIIADLNNPLHASIASFWEISIKRSLGKLSLMHSTSQILQEVRKQKITILPINEEHLIRMENLPFHHRDPFDRLIIAQAMSESLTILSRDSIFQKYDIRLKW